MRIPAVVLGWAVVGAVLVLQHPAGALPTASGSGSIDRTFFCAPTLVGGVRQIEARARKGSRRRGAIWDSPPVVGISTTVSGSVFTVNENELVWLTAGTPSAAANLRGALLPVHTWGTLGINGKRCRSSTARVSLARDGLHGGVAGPFDEDYDCVTPRRVLVRVRATLRTRASLKGYRGFLRTTVPVGDGSLEVQTDSGKPLVYAQVFSSGKSLLFTAPTCTPD